MAGIRWGISDYMIINDRLENLKSIIKSYESVFVAFSGGVDSTFLLKVAHEVLGDKCVAINVESDFVPEREEKDSDAETEKTDADSPEESAAEEEAAEDPENAETTEETGSETGEKKVGGSSLYSCLSGLRHWLRL